MTNAGMTAKELAAKYFKKTLPTLFDSGIGARLPEAYRKFYDEWRNTPPKPVHYIPYTGKEWVRDEKTGEVKRVENVPLPLQNPKELNYVLTGGEAVVQGFIKRMHKKQKHTNRVPRFWVPVLYRSVVYSEVLDKYLATEMTKRVVELIHEHQGFDNYLLQNKACDLRNVVALKLKQRILLALHTKDLPYDEKKNEEIFKKYEKYLIPPEEIEWYGLTFTEACVKLKKIEDEEKLAAIIPLKHVYRAQLIEELKEGKNQAGSKDPTNTESKVQWLADKVPGLSKFTKKSSPDSS